MLLTNSEVDEFQLRGFVRAKERALGDEEVELLREELDAILEHRKESEPLLVRNVPSSSQEERFFVQLVNVWEVSDPYLEHARHPEITSTVARLCQNTDTLRIWHDQIQYKPPRVGGPTPWHQDFPAWPILQPADLVSAWVALDDAEIDNGCMWMVPGSHRWGTGILSGTGPKFEPLFEPELLPDGVDPDGVKPEPLVVRKGEVAFHHCMTWHGSPSNLTDRPRRAIAVHYMPGYTIYAPRSAHPVEVHVRVQPGEVLAGEKFPIVYRRRAAVEAL